MDMDPTLEPDTTTISAEVEAGRIPASQLLRGRGPWRLKTVRDYDINLPESDN
jgi:hypothetical protein